MIVSHAPHRIDIDSRLNCATTIALPWGAGVVASLSPSALLAEAADLSGEVEVQVVHQRLADFAGHLEQKELSRLSYLFWSQTL